MNKSWKLIDKILSKEKVIESRWYKSKRAPWNKIKENDIIYFKDAGCKVTAKAEVEAVKQFENYSEEQLRVILNKYYKDIAFTSSLEEVFNWAKTKKHCILITLKNPERIKSFEINKKGFGNASAWITVDNIEKIKI